MIDIRLIAGAVLFLAVIGLGVPIYRAFRRDRAANRARAGASRVVATRRGACECTEAGAGPALLIAHGAGGGFDQGMRCGGADLARRGLRVISVSRFGYLRTPLPADASAAAQADLYAALLSDLGIERAAILGVSAGAPSAMQFALRHKHRCAGLVLLVPMAFRPGAHAGFIAPPAWPLIDRSLRFLAGSDFAYWLAARLLRRLLIGLTLATPPGLVREAPPDERARVDAIIDLGMPLGRRIAGILNDARICAALPRYDLAAIRVPTLAISCRDDRYGSFAMAEYTAAQIAGARFIGYPTGGHVWVGHNGEILSEIADFVSTAGAAKQP